MASRPPASLPPRSPFSPLYTLLPQLYRSALGLKALAGRVDRAFLGDQRVMQDWLLKRVSSSKPSSPGGDRGIVIPAGGVNQLANAFANLYVLRHTLHCRLPVTIAYWGALAREDVDPATVAFFKRHIPDVTFLDLSKVEYPGHQRWLFPPIPDGSFVGFKVKVFALYSAPYKEVLVIDSDSMPLLNPEPMFEHPEFKGKGNMFWPDRWCTPVKLFAKLGLDDGGGDRLQADSGQFLFDRSRHAAVLEWLLFLNTHNEFTYRYAHGDKDTYRAAFELAGAGEDYLQVPQPLSVALAPGVLWGAKARGFVQHHPNGSVAFVHRTSEAKYRAHSSVGRGFSRLLLQPTCQWSQRHWHFFSPALGAARSKVWRAAKCHFTLWDPAAAKEHCGSNSDAGAGADARPPLLEVPRTSFVGEAQTAADDALIIFHEHVKERPDLYPSHGGSGAVGVMLVLTAVGAGAWAAAKGVAAARRRRQWALLPAMSV